MGKHHSLSIGRSMRAARERLKRRLLGRRTIRRAPYAGWLSAPDEIADALLDAVAQGQSLMTSGGAAGALYATYEPVLEPMRRLASDLRRGVVDPLPVKWDARAPWTSGIEALRTYGRFPLTTKGRFSGAKN